MASVTGFDLGSKLLFQGSNANATYKSSDVLFNNILPNVYVAAGLVLLFMVLLGGFSIISGGSDSHKLDEGKKTITGALIGLLVLFSSFWIIQIIQIVTGVQILNSGL